MNPGKWFKRFCVTGCNFPISASQILGLWVYTSAVGILVIFKRGLRLVPSICTDWLGMSVLPCLRPLLYLFFIWCVCLQPFIHLNLGLLMRRSWNMIQDVLFRPKLLLFIQIMLPKSYPLPLHESCVCMWLLVWFVWYVLINAYYVKHTMIC